jgi:hypothetical protein
MPERPALATGAANSASNPSQFVQLEWEAANAMDEACNDDGVTCIRDSKEHRAPDIAIAQQIGRDRCSHHRDDDNPPSRSTKGDQYP